MSAGIVLAVAAAEINAAHAAACRHADKAIDCAKQAGRLLLQVKSQLPHGQWLPWLAANCAVSDRQAQRYIRAHRGLPLPLRAIKDDRDDVKNDAVSHFNPVPDACISLAGNGHRYFVEQSDHEGFFFVTVLRWDPGVGDDGPGSVEYTRRPVRHDYVGVVLRQWGLFDAASREWDTMFIDYLVKHSLLDPAREWAAHG